MHTCTVQMSSGCHESMFPCNTSTNGPIGPLKFLFSLRYPAGGSSVLLLTEVSFIFPVFLKYSFNFNCFKNQCSWKQCACIYCTERYPTNPRCSLLCIVLQSSFENWQLYQHSCCLRLFPMPVSSQRCRTKSSLIRGVLNN